MSTRKQIENENWQERLQTFTSGNKGQTAAIASQGMTIVENKPFDSVVYDPIRKGNDIVLAVDGFIHLVNAPVEIYIYQESDGVASSLEIVDQNGGQTFLRLI